MSAFGQRPCVSARGHSLLAPAACSSLPPPLPSCPSPPRPAPGPWLSACVSGPSARRWGSGGREGRGSSAHGSLAAAQGDGSEASTSLTDDEEGLEEHAARTADLLSRRKKQPSGWPSYLNGRGIARRKDDAEAAELGCAHCGKKATCRWHCGRRVCASCNTNLRIVDGEVQSKYQKKGWQEAWATLTAEERAARVAKSAAARGAEPSGWPSYLDAQGIAPRKDDADAAELGCAHCGRRQTAQWCQQRRICAYCNTKLRIVDGQAQRKHWKRGTKQGGSWANLTEEQRAARVEALRQSLARHSPEQRLARLIARGAKPSGWAAHLDGQGVPPRKDDAEAAELGCAHCGRKKTYRWHQERRICHSCATRHVVVNGAVQRRVLEKEQRP